MKATKSSLAVAATCAFGLGTVMYDNTAMIVALPTIRAAFSAETSSLQWILNGMSLMTGSMLPISGALGDKFGPRRMFQFGLLVFALAALAGSQAPSMNLLITARVLQGIGAAFMLPNCAALLSANVNESDRNRTVGLWISLSSVGLMLGPVGGGILIDHVGWRAALMGQVVFATLGIFRAQSLNDGPRRSHAQPIDFLGVSSAGLAVLALCWAIIDLGRQNRHTLFDVIAFLFGLLMLRLFFRTEKRVSHPLIDPNWFKDPRIRGILLACMIYNATIAGATFLISILSQGSRHLSPTWGGIIVVSLCILMPLGSRMTGNWSAQVGLRRIMVGAALGLAFIYVMIGAASRGPLPILLPTLLFAGLFTGLLFSGDTIAIMDSVESNKASSGLAALSLVRQIGGVVGVSLFVSISEVIGWAVHSTYNGYAIGIAICGVATISCWWLLRIALPEKITA